MGTNKRVSSEKKNLVLHLVHNRRRRQRDIALDLRISKSTVEKIVARHKRAMQGLAAWPTVLGAPRVLSSMDLAFIIGFLERTPDAYLYEIQSELWNFCGVEASLSTIWEALKFLGYTRKRVSPIAAQRDEDGQCCLQSEHIQAWFGLGTGGRTGAEARHIYKKREVHVLSYILQICFDPSRYSVLPAVSLSGVLHLDVLAGSYTAATFNSFIDGLLDFMNPFPGPNSVIVMDNAKIHKSTVLRPMIEQRGMRPEYLPPYSPDDPAEEGFSMKAWLRANRDYADEAPANTPGAPSPYEVIFRAVYESITPEKARDWFTHSGYS